MRKSTALYTCAMSKMATQGDGAGSSQQRQQLQDMANAAIATIATAEPQQRGIVARKASLFTRGTRRLAASKFTGNKFTHSVIVII